VVGVGVITHAPRSIVIWNVSLKQWAFTWPTRSISYSCTRSFKFHTPPPPKGLSLKHYRRCLPHSIPKEVSPIHRSHSYYCLEWQDNSQTVVSRTLFPLPASTWEARPLKLLDQLIAQGSFKICCFLNSLTDPSFLSDGLSSAKCA
jgi:hypothetical protein